MLPSVRPTTSCPPVLLAGSLGGVGKSGSTAQRPASVAIHKSFRSPSTVIEPKSVPTLIDSTAPSNRDDPKRAPWIEICPIDEPSSRKIPCVGLMLASIWNGLTDPAPCGVPWGLYDCSGRTIGDPTITDPPTAGSPVPPSSPVAANPNPACSNWSYRPVKELTRRALMYPSSSAGSGKSSGRPPPKGPSFQNASSE